MGYSSHLMHVTSIDMQLDGNYFAYQYVCNVHSKWVQCILSECLRGYADTFPTIGTAIWPLRMSVNRRRKKKKKPWSVPVYRLIKCHIILAEHNIKNNVNFPLPARFVRVFFSSREYALSSLDLENFRTESDIWIGWEREEETAFYVCGFSVFSCRILSCSTHCCHIHMTHTETYTNNNRHNRDRNSLLLDVVECKSAL